MYWSFLENSLPNETFYGENIKLTNFILGIDTEIHETTKIDTHEEKYFHSICVGKYVKNFDQAFQ